MAEGICKLKDGWIVEDSVCVRYPGGRELEIPASQYEDLGYVPPLSDLEWCKEKRASPDGS